MSGLVVDVDRMMENLHLQKDRISSEWLLFRLSANMGKMNALDKIHDLSGKAVEKGISLKEAIHSDSETGSFLTPEYLDYLDRPEQYVGHAVEIVDRAVAEIEKQRAADPKELS
jgi:3-carboxy-cis,cis-muconate cycloisomerase